MPEATYDENEKIGGNGRENLVNCIGEATLLATRLEALAMEARSIAYAYANALQLPRIVAEDKIAATPERMFKLCEQLQELAAAT